MRRDEKILKIFFFATDQNHNNLYIYALHYEMMRFSLQEKAEIIILEEALAQVVYMTLLKDIFIR